MEATHIYNLDDTLKTRTKSFLLSSILQKKTNKEWRVLVVDYHSMRVLSSALSMYDILEEGLCLIDNIEVDEEREQLPQLGALYFLSPSKDSISKLIHDFSQKPPRYGCCYLHFTSALSKEMFDEIKGSPLVPYLRTFKENNIDFLAYESNVFHFDTRESISLYFSSELEEYRDPYQKELAEKISGVCAVLESKPQIIRYLNVCSQLADICKRELNHLPLPVDPTCKLLILDRSFDLISPILHEFTYQAMMEDVLDDLIIDDEFRNVYTDSSGDQRERLALIDDTDPIFAQIKHKQIGDTMVWLDEKTKAFASMYGVGNFGKEKANGDIQNIVKMMREVPKFQELGSKYSIHADILKLLSDKPKKRRLLDIAYLEQDISTGVDSHGRSTKPTAVMEEIKKIVDDVHVNHMDIYRLLLLLCTNKEYKIADIEDMARLANMSEDEIRGLRNVRNLLPKEKEKISLFSALSKKKKPKFQENAYLLFRWNPVIKNLIESLSNNKLAEDKYPKISLSDSGKEKKTEWVHNSSGSKKSSTKTSARIIVFVVGGVSYSEMRSIYELMGSNKKIDIILGSTHIIKSNEFALDIQY